MFLVCYCVFVRYFSVTNAVQHASWTRNSSENEQTGCTLHQPVASVQDTAALLRKSCTNGHFNLLNLARLGFKKLWIPNGQAASYFAEEVPQRQHGFAWHATRISKLWLTGTTHDHVVMNMPASFDLDVTVEDRNEWSAQEQLYEHQAIW